MAPASSTWVSHGGVVADQRAGVRLRRLARLGAAARPASARPACRRRGRAGRRRGIPRPPDLLAVERDHAGGGVVGEEFDEIGASRGRPRCRSRSHRTSGRPSPSAARWKWPSRPPLWPTKATPSFDAALRLAREQHVQHHAVDVVGDAEAIGPDDGEAGRPRGGGDGVLRRCDRRPRQSPRRRSSPSRPCGARRPRSPRARPRPAA